MNLKIGKLLVISIFIIISSNVFAQTPGFTSAEYKKALWMTTRFYGGQRAGDNNWLLYNHLPSGVNASLTGKSYLGDADAGYDLSGGWFDCGDHVKFGQTEYYSAYMLLKGYEAFPTGYGDYYAYNYQGYKTSGSWNFEGTGHAPNGIPDVLDEVKHATDYFIKCARNSTTFYYQVGQGGPDHMLWETSVQMQTESVSNGGEPRVVYKNPNDASMSSFCGAALALMSRLYRQYDAAYADLCLVHAKYAYDYSKAHPGVAGTGDGGFYGPNDNWKDDYSSMCAELFWATNTAAYKTEALSYTIASAPGQGSDIWGKNYGFDYTNNGDIAIYNQALLGNASAKTVLNTIVNTHYKGNVQGDGQFNGGNTGWGPTRYNANTAFIVALNQKLQGTDATPDKYIYDNIDYLLGKNSSSQSFIVGFGTKSPKYPHHRNVYLRDNNPSDAIKATMTIPTKNQQFGLMVGGSRNPSSFSDNVVNYQHTEGGIDYNACLVGVLAYLNSVLAPVSQHPVPNLGVDVSLCGAGSVVLKANIPTDGKKTFTWKNGTTTVQAASTTANTYTAATAGTYTVILDSAGKWSTSDEIIVTASLPAVNLGSAVQLCNPATATLDIGVTGTGYTYQWKKNSVVISGATSKTFVVSSAGTYVGTLSASGCTSTSGSVVVTSALPLANHDTLCAAGTAALAISGSGGPYQWYSAATAGTLLTTGNSYSPNITGNTTYYVQDGSSINVTAGPSSASNPLTGGTNAGNIGMQFTASKAFTITELKVLPFVYSSPSNVFVTFDLKQGNTVVASYTSASIPSTGAQSGSPFNTFYTLTFPTPISIPATGDYTLIRSAGNDLVWFDAGANFSTMDAAGVIDITGDTRTDKTNSFPGIFDIKVQAGSSCARTPVYAIIDATYPNCSAAKTDQTITFGAITAKKYGDANFTLAATASSGLAVTYTSSNPAVATVTSAGVVTIVGVGSTIITASQAGNATYNAATAVTQTLVVGKADQTITFGAITSKVVGDANFTLAATASSGLSVTYTSSNPAVATVTSAGIVTIVGVGSTIITASQAGNANYNAATAVTQTLVVGKANQTITFGAITSKVVGDANFTLAATASSGLAVTYTSSDPTVATVTSAGVVTIVGAGSTIITASQSGNTNYNAATAVTQTLVVGKANQTITFGAITSKVVGDPNFTLAATASSGLAVTYSSSNPAVATVTSAGVVTIVGAGSTIITASQAGNANYNAATAVTQTLVVGKANQTITFGAITSKVIGDASFTLTATATSGLAVTYTSSNPAVATVTSAGVVTIVGAGSTIITASQAGNANYNAATAVTQTFVVTSPTKTNQTITFGTITSKGDPNFTLTSSSTSGLPITYTSSNPAVATVSSTGVVTIVGAGTAVITATQSGNGTYASSTSTQTLVVGKANQTITFGAITSKVVGDPNFTLTATASSALAVTYTSSNLAVATVTSAGVVTIVGAGSTVITASQSGNTNYNAAAAVTQTLVVTTPSKLNQTITFGAITSKVVGDPNFTLTATASSGLAVTYTSSNPAVATVTSAGVVTIVGAGSTIITASQAGNATYNAAPSATQTLTVTSPSKLNQTITFGALSAKTVGDASFTLTATASSGLAVTYTSSNPAVATVTSAGVVTIVGSGTTIITASQAGNATYNAAANVGQNLVVSNPSKLNQTITFGTLPSKNVGDASFTLTATASSGLAVTYTSSNPSVATVTSAGVVTIVGAGTAVITANQAGNATYNAAESVLQSLTVNGQTATSYLQVLSWGTVLVNNGAALPIGLNDLNVATKPSTFTLKNIGVSTINISSILASTGFSTTQIFPSGPIAPNQTVTFTVSGIPTSSTNPTNGIITLLSDDPGSPFTLNVSVAVGTPTGTKAALSSSAIELYPNPTQSNASLEFNGSFENIAVTVYTVDGNKVIAENLGSVPQNASREINVQELPAGVYFVEVNTDQGMLVKRLIKQ